MRALLSETGDLRFVRKWERFVADLYRNSARRLNLSPKKTELPCRLLAASLEALTRASLSGDVDYSPEELSSMVSRLFRYYLNDFQSM